MPGRNGNYSQEQHILQQAEGVISGVQAMMAKPVQQGRVYPGGVRVNGKDLCDCAINPTHCYRTVSQRSLSVPTRFLSAIAAVPNLPAAADIFAALFYGTASAALGLQVPGTPGVIFNDANVQLQRQRVYNLVLLAIRANVTVLLSDAEPVAVGAINVSTLQSRLEELAMEYINLKVYHSSDRNDPWIDNTNLQFFQREPGDYQLVPPVMWIDRDPAMELNIAVAEGGVAGAGSGFGTAPVYTLPLRDLEGVASVTVECLFIPDPYSCPDLWPGQLCPRDMIGNTPDYSGNIISAKRAIKRV